MLVEGNEGALLNMAVYIDLNPVRAGMVDKPEDYRFCGYAEALAGNRLARQGLGSILSESLIDDSFTSDWWKRGCQAPYRKNREILVGLIDR